MAIRGLERKDNYKVYTIAGGAGDVRKYPGFDLGVQSNLLEVLAALRLYSDGNPDQGTWYNATNDVNSLSGSQVVVFRTSTQAEDSFIVISSHPIAGIQMNVVVDGVDAGALATAWRYCSDVQDDEYTPKTWSDLDYEDESESASGKSLTNGTGIKNVKWIIPNDHKITKIEGIRGYAYKLVVDTAGYATSPEIESIRLINPQTALSLTVLTCDGTYDFHKNSDTVAGVTTDKDAIPLTTFPILDENGISNFIIKNLAAGKTLVMIVGLAPFSQEGAGAGSSTSSPSYSRIQDGLGTALANVVVGARYTWDNGEAKGTQSSSTLKDTDKAWGTDELAGMQITIHTEGGSTPPETKDILSNTADTITISGTWANNPVSGTTHYKVTDTGNGLLVKGFDVSIQADEVNITDFKAGHYKSSPPDLTENEDTQFLTDIKGRMIPGGFDAEGAALTVRPIPVAGKDGAGNVQALATDTSGQIQTAHDVNTNPIMSEITDGTTEAEVDATLKALKVDVKTALSGYDSGNDRYKFDMEKDSTLPSTVYDGAKTVASAGTAEALGSQAVKRGVIVQALSTNTGKVYVGGSGVSNASGIELTAGESVPIECDDIADVYIDVDTNAEGVKWTSF